MSRKIEGEERRLYDGSVTNPKELEAVRHEVEGLRSRRARVEEDLLEQMERREELEDLMRSAGAEVEEAKDRLGQITAEVTEELTEIEHALASRRTERLALVPEFDEELLELYEDLRRQKRGIGAAALENGVCQGCHQKLSAMELDRLKRVEGLKRCEYCRRILIFA